MPQKPTHQTYFCGVTAVIVKRPVAAVESPRNNTLHNYGGDLCNVNLHDQFSDIITKNIQKKELFACSYHQSYKI